MNSKKFTKLLLLIVGISRVIFQPIFALISDCDETFNYWEPLNLLVRGFGKQTWEYSPENSIRSWAFLLPFNGVLLGANLIVERNGLPSYVLFYLVRILLGLTSFIFEKRFYEELLRSMNFQVATSWLVFQLFNPGWFHASVELLPSSLAMIFLLGYLRYALRYLSTDKEKPFVSLLFYNFIAGVLCWPFVLILSVPLVLHYILNHKLIVILRTGFSSLLVLLMTAGITIIIDSLMYGKLTFVPWNIITYNVINASENSGPNIFGTEPWYYYIINLALNIPLPVLLFSIIGVFNIYLFPLWCSLGIWMIVFISQPHKEERFMYPIYGIITLAASIGYSKILKLIGSSKSIKGLFKTATYALLALQACTRIVALIENYTAPLQIFSGLPAHAGQPTNVCIGREWYHFPTSFFLPSAYRLKFVSSGFDGLLPGDFLESGSVLEAIRNIPPDMNRLNLFDPGKLVPIENCDYYVDIVTESDNTKDALDPTQLPSTWRRVICKPMIHGSNSKIFGRSFSVFKALLDHLPDKPKAVVERYYQANYVDFCLFQRNPRDLV